MLAFLLEALPYRHGDSATVGRRGACDLRSLYRLDSPLQLSMIDLEESRVVHCTTGWRGRWLPNIDPVRCGPPRKRKTAGDWTTDGADGGEASAGCVGRAWGPSAALTAPSCMRPPDRRYAATPIRTAVNVLANFITTTFPVQPRPRCALVRSIVGRQLIQSGVQRKLVLEFLRDRPQSIVEPRQRLIADLAWDATVICLGNSSRDAGDRVTVSAE